MDRRGFISSMASLSALAAFPALSGCSRSEPLRVGIFPWIGYQTLLLANGFHWLPEAVELVDTGDSPRAVDMLIAGKLDAACLTLDETLRACSKGTALTVVLVFDVSSGADVVMVHPAISHLYQIAGKRIGYEANAVGELMLTSLLTAAGLQRSDVHAVDMPIGKQESLWQSGAIDVAITYQPYAERLVRMGAQPLFDSRQIPNMIVDVLAVRRDVLERQERNLQGLAAGQFRALQHLVRNRDDALYRMSAYIGDTTDVVKQGLSGLILPTPELNLEYLGGDAPRLLRSAEVLRKLMLQHNLLAGDCRLSADFVDARAISRVEAP